MSNEEKILSILSDMQEDMKKMQADINSLKEQKEEEINEVRIRRQLETLNKMRDLLTEEEAESLARAVGEC